MKDKGRSHHGTCSPQHRSCPEQWGWGGGGWREQGEALTSHCLIAGQTHSAGLFFPKVPHYEGMGLGVQTPCCCSEAPPWRCLCRRLAAGRMQRTPPLRKGCQPLF